MNIESSKAIIEGLKAAGVDTVAILPDHGFSHVQKMIAEEPGFTYVPVSNEGIGVGICAGAYLGGKTPAIIIPTSGLLVAVWPLASLNNLWGIPLLLLVPYRGDVGDAFWVMRTYQFTTEPILNNLQIPYVIVSEIAKIKLAIKDAMASSFAWQNPICLLFTGETLR
ncbi:MAG: sulfopyruvate decarboxylase [Deltaproteobacteria bacterium]|nr:sulfopyruvate decarboxylase [Deltaproteobacteria bacterium]